MRLTTQDVERFIGGQIEIQNEDKGYIYRGEVEAIAVVDNMLMANCTWVAKGEGFPPFPKRWVREDRFISMSLELYSPSDIDHGDPKVGFCIYSFVCGEMVSLLPSDGSRLDLATVEGLQQLAQA